MTKRLEILKKSLENKTNHFDERLKNHMDTVALANGQPLNDKRNGYATMRKWDKQNDTLRSINKSIELTKNAIMHEQAKINYCKNEVEGMPQIIIDLLEAGKITQWRKYPNRFFVNGGGRARIIIENKKDLSCGHLNACTPEEREIFKKTFERIKQEFDALKSEDKEIPLEENKSPFLRIRKNAKERKTIFENAKNIKAFYIREFKDGQIFDSFNDLNEYVTEVNKKEDALKRLESGIYEFSVLSYYFIFESE